MRTQYFLSREQTSAGGPDSCALWEPLCCFSALWTDPVHTRSKRDKTNRLRVVMETSNYSCGRYAITCLNAFRNDSISDFLPIVTRMWFGTGGNSRPTCTFRSFIALIRGRTGRLQSNMMKFACEGIVL